MYNIESIVDYIPQEADNLQMENLFHGNLLQSICLQLKINCIGSS